MSAPPSKAWLKLDVDGVEQPRCEVTAQWNKLCADTFICRRIVPAAV